MSTKYKYPIVLFLIIATSLFLKLYYVDEYSTFTDELISALAAKSIGENGIPILSPGAIYQRALLHHYLLSIPINLFGLSFFSMRINSILFSCLTILIIYLLGIKVANRRVALAAALLLCLNSAFNQYSLAGRMYMTYGTFYILSIYFFYRGFLEGKSISKVISLCFMVATMLSSEAGLIIGPIFLFLAFIYQRETWYKDRVIIFGTMVWIPIAYMVLNYKFPGAIDAFTGFSGSPPSQFVKLKWSFAKLIYNISYLWRVLDGCIPFSVPFFIVMTLLVARQKKLKDHYPLMALIPALLVQSLFLHNIVQKRVTVSVVPLYILVCCHLFYTLWNWITVDWNKRGSLKKSIAGNARVITIAIVAFLLISVPFSLNRFQKNPEEFPAYLIYPFFDHRAKNNPQPAYMFVKNRANENDLIIQTTLEYGYYFLGSEFSYYFLRQRRIRNEYGKLEFISFKEKDEPYYGRPIIDEIDKLKEIMNRSSSEIWLILGEKSKWSVGPEIAEFIKNHFKLSFSENNTEVYTFKN